MQIHKRAKMERALKNKMPRAGTSKALPIDNGWLAELLACEAENASDTLRRAFKRASRAAFLWPEEAAQVHRAGRSLTELPAIGPYLEKILRSWIEEPPKRPKAHPLRQDFLTLAQARRVLASRPDWQQKYRGDLQMHTRWSDGAATISQMAEAAFERGYRYIAITDHSKGLKIAGGIDEEQLARQASEIEQVNLNFKRAGDEFRVLRSVEMNLNPGGAGDLDGRALKRLDLVVGAFHSKLRETQDQTDRYLAALRNPQVNILGHPRGRIYNHRIGLAADWARVFACAASLDKAVEIDSYPDRQDLNVDLLLIAKREGARIAIDTDAHAPEQLAFAELGLAAALTAKIPEDRILNFMSEKSLLEWASR